MTSVDGAGKIIKECSDIISTKEKDGPHTVVREIEWEWFN